MCIVNFYINKYNYSHYFYTKDAFLYFYLFNPGPCSHDFAQIGANQDDERGD